MLDIDLDSNTGIATLTPHGALSAADFAAAAKTLDPYIESHGKIAGVIIRAQHFPGWTSFAALLAHFKFVKNHHREVARVALCCDDKMLAQVAETLAPHFVKAEIRTFAFDELAQAKAWAAG